MLYCIAAISVMLWSWLYWNKRDEMNLSSLIIAIDNYIDNINELIRAKTGEGTL
jgi:hypothetical protein